MAGQALTPTSEQVATIRKEAQNAGLVLTDLDVINVGVHVNTICVNSLQPWDDALHAVLHVMCEHQGTYREGKTT